MVIDNDGNLPSNVLQCFLLHLFHLTNAFRPCQRQSVTLLQKQSKARHSATIPFLHPIIILLHSTCDATLCSTQTLCHLVEHHIHHRKKSNSMSHSLSQSVSHPVASSVGLLSLATRCPCPSPLPKLPYIDITMKANTSVQSSSSWSLSLLIDRRKWKSLHKNATRPWPSHLLPQQNGCALISSSRISFRFPLLPARLCSSSSSGDDY